MCLSSDPCEKGEKWTEVRSVDSDAAAGPRRCKKSRQGRDNRDHRARCGLLQITKHAESRDARNRHIEHDDMRTATGDDLGGGRCRRHDGDHREGAGMEQQRHGSGELWVIGAHDRGQLRCFGDGHGVAFTTPTTADV